MYYIIPPGTGLTGYRERLPTGESAKKRRAHERHS